MLLDTNPGCEGAERDEDDLQEHSVETTPWKATDVGCEGVQLKEKSLIN